MSQPLAILMLSESSYPRHPGGAGKCSHLLAAGLVARGHKVHLVSESSGETLREVIDGVEVHRLQGLDTSGLPKEEAEAATASHFLNYLEREVPLDSIDLVHDSGGFLSYFFPVELALKERWGLPLVLHYRYLMIRHRILETEEGRLDLLSRRFLGFETFLHISSQGFPARFADRVVALSGDDADFVQEHYRPSGGLEVIPDPVLMHDILANARAAGRRALSDNPEAPLVLFGGRIGDVRFKGTDIVYQAFERLRQAMPTCRLVLAANDETVVASFQDDFGDGVIVLGWIQEAQELAEILAAVDLVWMPSRFEPFGLMCAEAMAVGTPVFASPVGGLREMIEDGRSGLLLSADGVEEWAEELADRTAGLLQAPAERLAMGRRAQAFARKNLALESVVRRMETLYGEILAGSSTNRALGKPAITRPEWSEEDTSAYLDRLVAMAGKEARTHGQAVLAEWDTSVAERCTSCTHAHMAETLQALQRHGRSRLLKIFRSAHWREELAHKVAAVCPLALRQKELASRRSYPAGVDGLKGAK